ncbi:MAG TPA: carbon-nitrogen hydrolase family protein [Gaiellaceae bacterium]|nr:carbon-nitrogen hydrolase family protein [Gaiellaceae bacterium]
MSFRIAVVQPLSSPPPEDERNIEQAVRFVEEAAGRGAEFVAFPESYPGPWRMPATFDPTPAMEEVARRCGVYVQYGTLEPIDDDAKTAYNLLRLARPDGGETGKYRRTHPPGPWIYTGGRYWEFQYVPGDEYPTFETEHAVVGLAMCSEAYMPEVTRALALRGAELLFMPAGCNKQKLWATWRNLIWSRAIENLAVVVTTQNLFGPDDRGLAMVAAPEEILFESEGPGVFYVDVDLDRARELRAREDTVTSSLTEGAKAGLLTQWQRPELYERFFPREEAVP